VCGSHAATAAARVRRVSPVTPHSLFTFSLLSTPYLSSLFSLQPLLHHVRARSARVAAAHFLE